MKKIVIVFLVLLFGFITFIAIIGGGFGSKTNCPIVINGDPIVFAHRGGVKNQFVENSAEAFEKGIALGFNGIETDVRVTKDNKLVLFHDESCLRLLGVNQKVQDLNWDEVKALELIHAGDKTTNNVLLFNDFLQLVPDSIIIYLDIKVSSFSLANLLLEELKVVGNSKTIIIGDEDIVFLSYLKYYNPDLKVVLEGFNKGKEGLHYLIPKNFKPDYYASHISEVDSNHILFLKNNNILSNRIVYGVQSTNLAKVYELGIQNIIYDYDSLAINLLSLKSKLNQEKD